MSYTVWRQHIDASVKEDDRVAARCWNLEKETRISTAVEEFKRALGERHAQALRTGADGAEAACTVLAAMIDELQRVDCHWLGLLPVPPDRAAEIPVRRVTTYVPEMVVRNLSLSARLDVNDLHKPIRLKGPLKIDDDGEEQELLARFIWVTFDADGSGLPDDPHKIVEDLGLAHFPEGQHVFRIDLDVDAVRLFIPTCLDAGLFEAWAPPPDGHDKPWGMTRHLGSGKPARPELLSETQDHATVKPTARLVSPTNKPTPLGPVHKDFRANRPT